MGGEKCAMANSVDHNTFLGPDDTGIIFHFTTDGEMKSIEVIETAGSELDAAKAGDFMVLLVSLFVTHPDLEGVRDEVEQLANRLLYGKTGEETIN